MHAHTIESPRTQTRPADETPSGHDMTAVGTFACGQSAHGSFHVAADTDVGSFASGLRPSAPSGTPSRTE
jgi:hypothetical protein